MTVTTYKPRRRPALLLPVLAAIALLVGVIGVAAAQPSAAISISDLVPADGATVPSDQDVALSAFVTSDTPITSVKAFIDGSEITVQEVVGSGAVRAGFNATQSFTPGSHTMRVEATNVDDETTVAESTFTAVAGATASPSGATAATTPTGGETTTTASAAPQQLPPTGGNPTELIMLLAMGFGLAAVGLGLRRHSRYTKAS